MKKLILLLLMIAVILSLSACEGCADNSNSGSETGDDEPFNQDKDSEGLEFTPKEGGASCSVSGIGTCLDEYIVIPSTYEGIPVTAIEPYAFYDCNSIIGVRLPDCVTSIGNGAFSHCTSLTSITVDENNTNYKSIAGNLYSKDGKTLIQYAIGKTETSFKVPDSVTSIGNGAFSHCTSLTSVEIPDSVTSIGSSAFRYCTSLTSVEIGDSVTSIGNGAFSHCTSLTSITVDENNTNYKSIDGNLYSKDGKTLIQYAIGKTETSFKVPDSVTSIGEWAFEFCTSLTSIVVPDSVTRIGDSAFYDCYNLASVEIGDSVTSIGNAAFYSCTSLTSITVSENNTNYKSIDGNLYSKDGKTLIQYAIGKTDTSFKIPDSVTSISIAAFYSCTGLTSVVIPDSVTSIGYAAFNSCTNLTSVYYKGTAAEWEEITVGYDPLTDATLYYYSATEPTDTNHTYWHYVDGMPALWR